MFCAIFGLCYRVNTRMGELFAVIHRVKRMPNAVELHLYPGEVTAIRLDPKPHFYRQEVDHRSDFVIVFCTHNVPLIRLLKSHQETLDEWAQDVLVAREFLESRKDYLFQAYLDGLRSAHRIAGGLVRQRTYFFSRMKDVDCPGLTVRVPTMV